MWLQTAYQRRPRHVLIGGAPVGKRVGTEAPPVCERKIQWGAQALTHSCCAKRALRQYGNDLTIAPYALLFAMRSNPRISQNHIGQKNEQGYCPHGHGLSGFHSFAVSNRARSMSFGLPKPTSMPSNSTRLGTNTCAPFTAMACRG